jgi:type II secretory pathway pseudopilin PulG
LLVVIGIIAVLAAILFPVFAAARGKAHSVRCVSNLRQIGMAMSMYMDDYDGFYPWGVDPADRLLPVIWSEYPVWQSWIQWMPYMHEVVDPYIRSRELWHCPSDGGFDELEDSGLPLAGRPEAFQAFGTSYMYRTELTFSRARQEALRDPVKVNVLFDGYGSWHGGRAWGARRWNVLHGDGHVKSANRAQYDEGWSCPVF